MESLDNMADTIPLCWTILAWEPQPRMRPSWADMLWLLRPYWWRITIPSHLAGRLTDRTLLDIGLTRGG